MNPKPPTFEDTAHVSYCHNKYRSTYEGRFGVFLTEVGIDHRPDFESYVLKRYGKFTPTCWLTNDNAWLHIATPRDTTIRSKVVDIGEILLTLAAHTDRPVYLAMKYATYMRYCPGGQVEPVTLQACNMCHEYGFRPVGESRHRSLSIICPDHADSLDQHLKDRAVNAMFLADAFLFTR